MILPVQTFLVLAPAADEQEISYMGTTVRFARYEGMSTKHLSAPLKPASAMSHARTPWGVEARSNRKSERLSCGFDGCHR